MRHRQNRLYLFEVLSMDCYALMHPMEPALKALSVLRFSDASDRFFGFAKELFLGPEIFTTQLIFDPIVVEKSRGARSGE